MGIPRSVYDRVVAKWEAVYRFVNTPDVEVYDIEFAFNQCSLCDFQVTKKITASGWCGDCPLHDENTTCCREWDHISDLVDRDEDVPYDAFRKNLKEIKKETLALLTRIKSLECEVDDSLEFNVGPEPYWMT
jgi:hypothetical protein